MLIHLPNESALHWVLLVEIDVELQHVDPRLAEEAEHAAILVGEDQFTDLIWGDEFGLIREEMLETTDIDRRFAIMETFLLNKFSVRLVMDDCVAFAVGEMSRSPDRQSMARMSAKIGYSQKHFISMFKQRVGLTPKAYLKIMRFQKAISRIEETPHDSIDWPAIAYDCGFFDQSHFINDFRVFSGFTPEEYLSKKDGDYLNYVPVG